MEKAEMKERTIETNGIKGFKVTEKDIFSIAEKDKGFAKHHNIGAIVYCETCCNVCDDNIVYNCMIDELQCEACFEDYCKAGLDHDDNNLDWMKWNYDWIREALGYDLDDDLEEDLPEDDLWDDDDDDFGY